MSKKLYPETDIQNIANAIRNLNGSSDTYTVSQMASAIALPENGYYLKESTEANPLSITDGEELNAQSCEVSFEPIQDLNGYDSPWIDSNVINKEPYLMRAVGGTATRIGNSLYDTLVGGTVAFNQLVKNGNFADTSIWENLATSFSVSNNVAHAEFSTNYRYVRQDIQAIVGHKYLSFADIRAVEGTMVINIGADFTITNSNFERFSVIFEADSTSKYFMPLRRGSSSATVIGECKNCMFIDLTAMFGSTIADYIYSLEQATAGSGVAYFKSLFPKDYYDYNAGQLMSVKALSHKMVGFNQWNEEWESGAYDSNGNKSVNVDYIRSKNFITVLPNTTYYFKVPTAYSRVCFYDSNKGFIERSNAFGNGTFVTPSNCNYATFFTQGNTYQNNICINLHWDGERDGEYEAYSEHVYPLDSDLELRGIPKLDANNKLYYDGDTYESDGTVTRKYAVVDLGSLSWGKIEAGSGKHRFATSIALMKPSTLNIICSNYPSSTSTYGGIFGVQSSNYNIYIFDSDYENATSTEFKTAMSGVYLVYELETPTTETADTFQNPQLVDNWGTEEYTDSREVQIPVGHETYQANICEISGWDSVHLYQDTEQTETPEITHTATFPSTVYSGEHEFVSGKLQKTYDEVVFDGDESWNVTSGTGYYQFALSTSTIKDYINALCDKLPMIAYSERGTKSGVVKSDDSSIRICFNTTDGITTREQFNQWINDNKGLTICAELATPTEITLTPSQIALLENNNVLWSDSNGNVKLKYFSKSLT